MLLATHTFGCIWWKVGQDTGDEGWMYRDLKVVRALLHYDPFDSDDELLILGDGSVNKTHLRFLIDDVPMSKKYLTALYWALTMVMKSPWLAPSMANEQIFASIILILGAMLFAAFIGNFTTAIVAFDKVRKRDSNSRLPVSLPLFPRPLMMLTAGASSNLI